MDDLEFNRKVSEWEMRIEDILVDMSDVKTVDHINVLINAVPLMECFTKTVENLRNAREGRNLIIIESSEFPFSGDRI